MAPFVHRAGFCRARTLIAVCLACVLVCNTPTPVAAEAIEIDLPIQAWLSGPSAMWDYAIPLLGSSLFSVKNLIASDFDTIFKTAFPENRYGASSSVAVTETTTTGLVPDGTGLMTSFSVKGSTLTPQEITVALRMAPLLPRTTVAIQRIMNATIRVLQAAGPQELYMSLDGLWVPFSGASFAWNVVVHQAPSQTRGLTLAPMLVDMQNAIDETATRYLVRITGSVANATAMFVQYAIYQMPAFANTVQSQGAPSITASEAQAAVRASQYPVLNAMLPTLLKVSGLSESFLDLLGRPIVPREPLWPNPADTDDGSGAQDADVVIEKRTYTLVMHFGGSPDTWTRVRNAYGTELISATIATTATEAMQRDTYVSSVVVTQVAVVRDERKAVQEMQVTIDATQGITERTGKRHTWAPLEVASIITNYGNYTILYDMYDTMDGVGSEGADPSPAAAQVPTSPPLIRGPSPSFPMAMAPVAREGDASTAPSSSFSSSSSSSSSTSLSSSDRAPPPKRAGQLLSIGMPEDWGLSCTPTCVGMIATGTIVGVATVALAVLAIVAFYCYYGKKDDFSSVKDVETDSQETGSAGSFYHGGHVSSLLDITSAPQGKKVQSRGATRSRSLDKEEVLGTPAMDTGTKKGGLVPWAKGLTPTLKKGRKGDTAPAAKGAPPRTENTANHRTRTGSDEDALSDQARKRMADSFPATPSSDANAEDSSDLQTSSSSRSLAEGYNLYFTEAESVEEDARHESAAPRPPTEARAVSAAPSRPPQPSHRAAWPTGPFNNPLVVQQQSLQRRNPIPRRVVAPLGSYGTLPGYGYGSQNSMQYARGAPAAPAVGMSAAPYDSTAYQPAPRPYPMRNASFGFTPAGVASLRPPPPPPPMQRMYSYPGLSSFSLSSHLQGPPAGSYRSNNYSDTASTTSSGNYSYLNGFY